MACTPCGRNQLTLHLGKKDFIYHLHKVDPIDSMVLMDPDYLKDCKVFVTLICNFSYGHVDLDLRGLSFLKDLFITRPFPQCPTHPGPHLPVGPLAEEARPECPPTVFHNTPESSLLHNPAARPKGHKEDLQVRL